MFMSPLIEKSRRLKDGNILKYQVPLYEEYAALMRKLEPPTEYEETNEEKALRLKKREDLLGPDLDMISPDLTQEVAMLRDLGLLQYWDQFDLWRKAEIIAEYRLSGMAEVLRQRKRSEEQAKTKKP
jgi:hypothetical protein